MLDNIQIAILTKVNELADRFSIKPYEFVAVIDNRHRDIALKYEVPLSGAASDEARFDRMLDLLGIGKDRHELSGTAGQIIDALDGALRSAPRKRVR